METPSTSSKSKNKFLKISFNNLPFSPNKIKNRKKNKKIVEEGKKVHHKYELKNGGVEESLSGPASPTISCMGQIKHKKKREQNVNIYFQKEILPFSTPQAYYSKNKSSVIKPMFFLSEAEKIPSNMRHNGRNYDASYVNTRPLCLNQMKRFASCRGGELSNFDWKIARMELDHLDEYFEEWKNDYQVDEDDFEDDEEGEDVEVIGIPMSAAPMAVIGGGGGGGGHDQELLKKREEINIWQRRTIDKPMPLNIQRCH